VQVVGATEKKCIVDIRARKHVLPCDVTVHDKYGVQDEFLCMRSHLEGDKSEFNRNIYMILKEKEAHNHIRALIKNNSKFYIPLIQTNGSEI
jgi:hypothetical protein